MALIGKFGSVPGGLWRRVAGHLPGGGNRALHDWVIAQLDVRPGDGILELGCGPDAAMHRILKTCKSIYVVGVDASADAVEQAWDKNRRAIRAGRAMLVQTDAARGLPAFAVPFARAVAVNATLPAKQAVAILRVVRRAMAPGGRIAIAVQPQDKEATEADARRIGKDIRRHLEAAGFATVRLHEKVLRPAAAVCVTGVNPK